MRTLRFIPPGVCPDPRTRSVHPLAARHSGGDRWENSIVEGICYGCIEPRGESEGKGQRISWKCAFEFVGLMTGDSPGNLIV